MTHSALIEKWTSQAAGAYDRAYRFFRWLKGQPSDQVDAAAKETHQEVFRTLRCTECANCCRTLKPQFLPGDIQAASVFLGLSKADFTEKYLQKNNQGNWATNALPCPFLAENGYCQIYQVRPGDCRGYPHTDKRDFASRSWSHTENIVTCPAVFAIMERLTLRMAYVDPDGG